jgi:hypothetical protein
MTIHETYPKSKESAAERPEPLFDVDRPEKGKLPKIWFRAAAIMEVKVRTPGTEKIENSGGSYRATHHLMLGAEITQRIMSYINVTVMSVYRAFQRAQKACISGQEDVEVEIKIYSYQMPDDHKLHVKFCTADSDEVYGRIKDLEPYIEYWNQYFRQMQDKHTEEVIKPLVAAQQLTPIFPVVKLPPKSHDAYKKMKPILDDNWSIS